MLKRLKCFEGLHIKHTFEKIGLKERRSGLPSLCSFGGP